MRGVVKKVNLEKLYGFISPDHGGGDFFFHRVDINISTGPEFDETLTGRRVEFEAKDSDKGPRAVNIRRVDD